MNRAAWEHFSHEADVGIRGFGVTPAEAFEQAAVALTAVVTHAEIKLLIPVEVSCKAPDLELLFVDWLNAVIYEMAIRKMLFGCFAVAIEGTRLNGILWGEPVDVARHAPACEPKGATYTALQVRKNDGGLWSAGCVGEFCFFRSWRARVTQKTRSRFDANQFERQVLTNVLLR